MGSAKKDRPMSCFSSLTSALEDISETRQDAIGALTVLTGSTSSLDAGAGLQGVDQGLPQGPLSEPGRRWAGKIGAFGLVKAVLGSHFGR